MTVIRSALNAFVNVVIRTNNILLNFTLQSSSWEKYHFARATLDQFINLMCDINV